MKIAHLTNGHHAFDTRVFHKQCKSLAKVGYDVSLVVPHDKDVFIDGVQIRAINIPKSRFNRMFLSAWHVYKTALCLDADIYHLHDPILIPVGLLLKRRNKIVVFDSHEDLPREILEKEWIPALLRQPLSKLAEIYMKRTLKKYDAVITVSVHIVESLKKASHNVHCVTNYPIVDNSLSNPSMAEYMKRDNHLCYAGTVYPSSSQSRIIEAIKGMHNLNYTIVGNIDDSHKAYLLRNCDTQNVIFRNHVPREILMDIYRSATIGMAIFDYLPNLGYTKGTLGNNKLFEYMCYSLPVICTDFTLWKEIIDKYKCGIYVNPNSIDEIRSAVKYLVENRAEAYQMGQNARRAVIEEYNWATEERKLLQVYRDII